MHEKPHKQRSKHKILQLRKPIVSKAMELGTFFFLCSNLTVLTIAGHTVAQLQQERRQTKFQASSLNTTGMLNEELRFL